MRFREIREIREVRPEKEKKEEKNYLKIKPETDISEEECREFWDRIFGEGTSDELQEIANEAWLIGRK